METNPLSEVEQVTEYALILLRLEERTAYERVIAADVMEKYFPGFGAASTMQDAWCAAAEARENIERLKASP